MSDTLDTIGHSLIQHGPDSNRIYLMKLNPVDLPELPAQLDALAMANGYTKIFAKVPEPCASAFIQTGYRREGAIARFYKGSTDAAFLGKFFDPHRAVSSQPQKIEKIIALAEKKQATPATPCPAEFHLRMATEADAPELAALYRQVFASYPFPIHDPDYLIETMRSHIRYAVAEKDGCIVAAASGEMDLENRNAEMTDFATLPKQLGRGLAVHLLTFLQDEMRSCGILTLFTIARSVSPGINITFARCGYTFGGTLINNTQISGSIESMNLWHRPA